MVDLHSQRCSQNCSWSAKSTTWNARYCCQI